MEDSAGLVDQAGGCCTRRRVDQLLHERPAQGDGGSHADVASWTVHADTHSWAFGTGNYGYNRGYVYVDDASFMRWTIAWLVDKSNMGTAPGATSSTTIAFTTTESAASGAWIFVVVAWCCAGTLSKPGSTVSPSGGDSVAGGRGVNG
jgi:hypothetical protein